MRLATLIVIGLIGTGFGSPPAVAVSPAALGLSTSSAVVEIGGRACPQHYHWVRNHHARNGELIPGHCAHNRH